MKGKNKKLIALLATFCMAAAATAMAGCVDPNPADSATVDNEIQKIYQTYAEAAGDDALSYEDWLASIKGEKGDKGDKGDKGEPGKDATVHEHNNNSEMVVLVEPTGISVGYGAVVCSECGTMSLVEIPVLEGIVKDNPIEMKAGDQKTISINKYDSDRYGVDVDKGEKNVAYFKVQVDKTGYVALPMVLPEGVNVDYKFYYADTYADDDAMYSRNVWVADDSTEPKYAYIKATFTADVKDAETGELYEIPATVDVAAQVTVLDTENYEGKAKFTIKLSKGTAQDIKVYNAYGEVNLMEDGEAYEGSIGDYKPFKGTNMATVWLEPGNYTYEIVDLDENYYVIDDAKCVVNFTDDGKYDSGADLVVNVGKQYEYKFTVTDSNDAAIPNASVILSNNTTGGTEALSADENGVVTTCVKENYDEAGDAVFDYLVTIANLGFAQLSPDAVALSLDSKEVTIKAVAAPVAEWAADGTKYNAIVALEKATAWGKLTIAEDGKYTMALSCEDDWFAMDKYAVTVDGVEYTLGGNGRAFELTKDVELTAGTHEIVVASQMAGYDIQVSFTKVVEVPATDIVLDSNNQVVVSAGTEYKWTAPAAGDYAISFDTEAMGDMLVYHTKEEADADTYAMAAWVDGMAINNGDRENVEIITVSEGEAVFIYIRNYADEPMDVTLTIAEYVAPVATPLTLDVATKVEKGSEYTFTATFTGTVYLTCSQPLCPYDENTWTYAEWVQIANQPENMWDDTFEIYYNSIEVYSAAFEVTEGVTYTFYASQAKGEALFTIASVQPNEGAK